MKKFSTCFMPVMALFVILFWGRITAFASDDATLATHGYPVGDSYMARLSYSTLSADEQRLWDNLMESATEYLYTDKNFEYIINGSTPLIMYNCKNDYDLSMDEIAKVYSLFKYSNPEFYFLSNPCHDDECSYYFRAYNDFINGEERFNYSQSFFDKLLIYSQNVSGYSADEINQSICQLISENTSYNENASHYGSACGVLCDGMGVCASYSLAVSAVCNMKDIDSLLICSDDHAWNYIKIDSTTWKQYDSTNDNYLPLRFAGSQYQPKKDYAKLLTACEADSNSYNPLLSVISFLGGLLAS